MRFYESKVACWFVSMCLKGIFVWVFLFVVPSIDSNISYDSMFWHENKGLCFYASIYRFDFKIHWICAIRNESWVQMWNIYDRIQRKTTSVFDLVSFGMGGCSVIIVLFFHGILLWYAIQQIPKKKPQYYQIFNEFFQAILDYVISLGIFIYFLFLFSFILQTSWWNWKITIILFLLLLGDERAHYKQEKKKWVV